MIGSEPSQPMPQRKQPYTADQPHKVTMAEENP
jgi:hypothetical protein